MNARKEARDYLASRRARLTPADAGIPSDGVRRVPGLRREEVAALAGVSVQYYTRLERGDLSHASESVLEALSRALRLDATERLHLFDLARALRHSTGTADSRAVSVALPEHLPLMLDSITGSAAFVRNYRFDLLAANPAARALYVHLLDDPALQTPNTARYCFLDPRARDFFVDWERGAADMAAILRSVTARRPRDPELSDLIGELASNSQEFRRFWARHDVKRHIDCVKHFRHPTVGEIRLAFETMPLTSAPDLSMVVYTPGAGNADQQAFALLAGRDRP